MSPIIPPARPGLSHDLALQILAAAGVTEQVAVLGRRGYMRDSMGIVGKNDRNVYDDAIAIVTPTAFATFNANTDPSAWRAGVASLKAGVWRYKTGIHGLSRPKDRQYLALVQAGPVTVRRDQSGEETGYFGINIHRGGYNMTSSLGCQTIFPGQWIAFIALVKNKVARYAVKTFPYCLTERA